MMEPDGLPPVLTVGYGNRSWEEFLALLEGHGVTCLVDARTAPYSRSRPEFCRPALEEALPGLGIRYVFQGQALGGRPEAPECYIDGTIDYERVREQEFFRKGIERLRRAHAQGMRLALMCAEGRPEECHRSRLLGVSLAALGIPVLHLDETGQPVPHAQVMARLAGAQPGLFEESAPVPAAPPDAPEISTAPDLEAARKVLARVFGYPEFRPLQGEIIGSVLRGRDTLCVMPTGAGKSLCYQLPALLSDGLTVVISPLLSLMQDQVDQLRAVGVSAVTLNSAIPRSTYAAHVEQVRSGEAKLLYVAPETLLRPETLQLLGESRVTCFTVDEAHCISEWGHDFRPEYRQLRSVRGRFPRAVCLALTATATTRVRDDIMTTLGIRQGDAFIAPFDRPNLYLEVRTREDGTQQVLEFVQARGDDSGIIYCNTREQVDTLTARLQEKGVRALPYHAGLDDRTRETNQRLFIRDEVPVIVATVAFGMGINKPNVRYVLHQAMPNCLETYYQQIGRAGRDGLRSDCLLLFARADIATAYHFIQEGDPRERAGRMARLQAMNRYAESTLCRRRTLLGYFDDAVPEEPCGMCDNCLAEAGGRARVDVTEDARLFLQAVLETRQRFGRVHVVAVLRGSQSERVRKWRHHELPVHGQGKHRSDDEWRLLSDQFIEQGLLEAEMQHGTLRLTEQSRGVLEEGEKVLAVLEEQKPVAGPAESVERDHALFDLLRGLRKEIADEANVPPYVIFSDRSLAEMSAAYPQEREDLLRIHGVGEHKAALYGDRFLEVIRAYAEERGYSHRPLAPPPPPPKPSTGERSREVGRTFREGLSIAELQERWGVTQQTIVQHLYNYVRDVEPLDAERLLGESRLPEDDRERVLAAFERLGHERLGPVFAELKGAVDYPELHLLRLYRICQAADG